MSYDVDQYRHLVRRTLKGIDRWSWDAEQLILGTTAKESGFGRYFRQLNGGPARGPLQIEPRTEIDNWVRYINFRPYMRGAVGLVTGVYGSDTSQLEYNVAYGIAMARIKYRRIPAPLPDGRDVYAMGQYWFKYYCCNNIPGQVEQFVAAWHRFGL
jgi:hypothetical protein